MRIESVCVGLGYYQFGFDWDSSVFMIEFHRNVAYTCSIEITKGEGRRATISYVSHHSVLSPARKQLEAQRGSRLIESFSVDWTPKQR
jgi:hypothetical protein